VRHSKLSASVVRWVPPLPLPAGRKNRKPPPLVSPLHRSTPRTGSYRSSGTCPYPEQYPRASKPGGISPRSLQRTLPFWLAPAGALPGALQGRFAPLRSDPYPWGINTSSSAPLHGKDE
jgi:hypothetical protein